MRATYKPIFDGNSSSQNYRYYNKDSSDSHRTFRAVRLEKALGGIAEM